MWTGSHALSLSCVPAPCDPPERIAFCSFCGARQKVLRLVVPCTTGGTMRHTQRMNHLNASLDLRRGPRVEARGSVTFEGEGHIGKGKIFNVSSWGCGVESI